MLGETLREAREKAGLTCVQLAERTNLLTSVVEEIEQEDFHRIAAPIYGRGFIKLLGEELGFPSERIAELQREFAEIYTGARAPRSSERAQKMESAPVSPEPILPVAIEEVREEQDSDVEDSAGSFGDEETAEEDENSAEMAEDDGRLVEEEHDSGPEAEEEDDLFAQAERVRRMAEEQPAPAFECAAEPPSAGDGREKGLRLCAMRDFLVSVFGAARRTFRGGATWVWARKKQLALAVVGIFLVAVMVLGAVLLFRDSTLNVQTEVPLAPPEMYVD